MSLNEKIQTKKVTERRTKDEASKRETKNEWEIIEKQNGNHKVHPWLDSEYSLDSHKHMIRYHIKQYKTEIDS